MRRASRIGVSPTRRLPDSPLVLAGAVLLAGLLGSMTACGQAQIVFQTVTPYHNIQVVDSGDLRILSFDGAQQTRMSRRDPLTGHFGYTEFFHMPWLWHTNMSNVLMIGLGGGSAQRAYAHYYSNVVVDTVEIDPVVLRVARAYFHFQESPRQRVQIADGRVFLRRTQRKFDAIILDAYTENRYGSFIPQHLATKEFFELANTRLTENGVLAYNVIGRWRGAGPDIVGALFKTLQAVFPQVYAFKADDSENVVFLATRWPYRFDFNVLQQRAAMLIRRGQITLPTFRQRLYGFQANPPMSAAQSPVLTDDYAPVEGLLKTNER